MRKVIAYLTLLLSLLIPFEKSFASIPFTFTENISMSLRGAGGMHMTPENKTVQGVISSVQFSATSVGFGHYSWRLEAYNSNGNLLGRTSYVSGSTTTGVISFPAQSGVQVRGVYNCNNCSSDITGTLIVQKTAFLPDLGDLEAIERAAKNAETAANQGRTAAQNTQNTINTIISPKLTLVEGAVRDSSGNTAISMAQAAKSSADTAASRALTASQNASNAKTSADTAAANALTAANRAQQAIDHTWESSENKSAATLSKEARDKANEAVETINEVSSNLDEKIDTLQNNITNIQNFIAPSLMKVSGFKNATATRSNSFNVMLDYSGANEYRYKLNNGGWSSWISLSSHDSNGYVSIGGVSTTGHHTATIEIRYNGGDVQSPVARGSISFFKL